MKETDERYCRLHDELYPPDGACSRCTQATEPHTPGPWRWADWSAEFGTREVEDRKAYLEHNPRHGRDPGCVVREREEPRCVKVMSIGENYVEHAIENPEDRRLIAAVPELAQAIHDLLDDYGGNMEVAEYERLRALAGPRSPVRVLPPGKVG